MLSLILASILQSEDELTFVCLILQYTWDVSTTMGFLESYGLGDDFQINVECNHATLAGHSCEHEVAMASAYGILGSLDANTGDAQTV